ncbi:MAG: ATP-binding protein [Candidatus Omnitrophota bacterium]
MEQEKLKNSLKEPEIKEVLDIRKANEEIKDLHNKLKEKDQELRKIEQIKSEFISTVSHELRTPLAIAKEGINLILDKIVGEVNPKQEGLLISIKSNILRLARIIDSLLDVSRLESGKIEFNRKLTDIIGLIKEVFVSFEPRVKVKGLELKARLPDKRVDVYVDKDKITKVLGNLLSNAIKFTEKGFIEVSLKEKESEVECAVTDTGIGISKDNMALVFDKFQQFGRTAGPGEKGTGLGLAIAKGIIDIHQGKIWLESTVGKGSKFIFTLPKFSIEKLFKENLEIAIKKAVDSKNKMSLISISIMELDKLKKDLSVPRVESLLKEMEVLLTGTLRQKGDISLKVHNDIFVILASCSGENALRVKTRIEQLLEDYLEQKQLSEKIRLSFGCATYPDDAKNTEELIKKLKK